MEDVPKVKHEYARTKTTLWQKQVAGQGLGVEQLALECRIGPGNHRCLTRSPCSHRGTESGSRVEDRTDERQWTNSQTTWGAFHQCLRTVRRASCSKVVCGDDIEGEGQRRSRGRGQPNRDVMGPLTNTTQ